MVTVTSILVFRAGEVDPQAFLLLFCLDVFFYWKAEALIFEVFQEAWQEVWQNMLKHVEAVVFAKVQFTSIQALPASMAKRLFLFGGLHFCYSIKTKPISYYIGLVRNYQLTQTARIVWSISIHQNCRRIYRPGLWPESCGHDCLESFS